MKMLKTAKEIGKQDVWMRSSIYYNKECWHILLQDCIKPLISDLHRNKQILNFFIAFNAKQGDNIRFAVHLPLKRSVKTTVFIDQYLKSFLEKNKSPDVIQTYPLKNFFINYPNNQVKYNFFNNTKNPTDGEVLTRQYFSKALIGAFKDSSIDSSATFTFILYVQLTILKVLFADKLSAKGALCNINYNYTAELTKEQLHKIEVRATEAFFKNRLIMAGIMEDVWEHPLDYSSDLKWLQEIETLTKKVQTRSNSSLDTLLELFRSLHELADLKNHSYVLSSVSLLLKVLN